MAGAKYKSKQRQNLSILQEILKSEGKDPPKEVPVRALLRESRLSFGENISIVEVWSADNGFLLAYQVSRYPSGRTESTVWHSDGKVRYQHLSLPTPSGTKLESFTDGKKGWRWGVHDYQKEIPAAQRLGFSGIDLTDLLNE